MFKMTVLLKVLVVLGFCGVKRSNAIEDYCSLNTFEDDVGGLMHFTKEPTNEEFAIVGKFKGLHCCAKGYKSIEWFKDGQPYPWGLDLSTLVIFPENANQTIFTHHVQSGDTGVYSCLLRNETVMQTHTINLKVFDKLPDDPKITYVSEDKEVYAGDTTRLLCEAFGGRVNLPDAHSEVIWLKELTNGSTIEVPAEVQKTISREEGQTFGTYLIFNETKLDDYATYICVISKPGNTINKSVTIKEKVRVQDYINRNPFPLKEVLIFSIVAIILLATGLVVIKQYGLRGLVMLKDRFGTVEENDGKRNDVLIAYAPKDSELVLGVMVPNLEGRGYNCVAKELSPDITNWSTTLSQQAPSSRRLITILSPGSLKNSWISTNLYQALKQLQSIETPRLICVSLKDLPFSENEAKNGAGETLASVARSMNVITWERSNDSRFWLNLCRELPAKRGTSSAMEMTHQSRPRLTSERSVDNLMVV
ncbi:single Ig IL-1-related receptor-like [Euwallacea similis]|uniref:single Ig IL-1-related receptor-like n=1 Tax=Euwallacea similis TaxID=1736056 RepID=UPI00344E2860